MTVLPDGRFAVRDDGGIQFFSEDGEFIQHIGEGYIGRCYGLTTDGKVIPIRIKQDFRNCDLTRFRGLQGHLITLNFSSRQGGLTAKGQTDVFFISIETGLVANRIELTNVIPRGSAKKRSLCRFLYFQGGKLYIVDLGKEMCGT